MENIKLVNSAILIASTNVSEEDKAVIDSLLKYRNRINIVDNTIRLDQFDNKADTTLIGSDAVHLYAFMHKISLAIIHEIDVSEIINSCEDMIELSDIVHLLNEVDNCNDELDTMLYSDIPEAKTYGMLCKLQTAVEHLVRNSSCEHPATNSNGRILTSLRDINYKFKS